LIYHERVIEAVTVNANLDLEKTSDELIYSIGSHARDVLHKLVKPCFTYKLMIDLLAESQPAFADMLDPWNPQTEPGGRLNWVDPSPLLDMALGAAIIGLRGANPHPTDEKALSFDRSESDAIASNALIGVNNGIRSLTETVDGFSEFLNNRGSISSGRL
jgi:hypothetical protein